MLKVFLGVLVSVVVLLSSAYVSSVVPRAYAASATVMIARIQAGGVGAATQEFIVIHNNSPNDVDITDWCVMNKTNVVIGCFTGTIPTQTVFLSGYHDAVMASDALAVTLPVGTATVTYTPSNQSSGSITGSGDTISLVDQDGATVDRYAWTTPIAAGMQFERHISQDLFVYVDTDMASDWSVTLPGPFLVDDTKAVKQLTLNEILPNAVGSDDGQEFIEIFNPHNEAVPLAAYELRVGSNYEHTYYFPDDSKVEPRGYISFTNSDIPFSLLNSSSRVALAVRGGGLINETAMYTNPKDGQSWALIDSEWAYTNHPTPGAMNLATGDSTLVPQNELVPLVCAANQYRNLETNRCRLLVTVPTVTPCKDGQYRSEETNRCRSIAADIKAPTPCSEDEERNLETNRCRKIVIAVAATACKEGQERSPDTHRCRTVVKMPSAGYGVLGAETKSSGSWYVLAAVGGVLALALGYAVWEWHDEIGKFFRGCYFRVLQFARLRK